MSFRQAFSLKDKDGMPILAHLQMNRDTFLEVGPASADHPVGFSHGGISVDDINKTVAILRELGVKMEDPRAGGTKAVITNMFDPDGIRRELLEYPPESVQRKAIDGWK